MAGIDKTYLNKWEQFDQVRNWALDKSFKLKNGQIIHLKNYMYYPNMTKEEWDERYNNSIKYAEEHYNTPEYIAQCKEWYGNDWEFNVEDYFDVVLWNTPIYVDIWLIRNCPFDFIQERLKEQYGGGWSKEAFTGHNDDDMYEQIKNGTSIYDTYQRNGLGKNAKIHFHNYKNVPRDKKCFWWIEVDGLGWWYNEDDNMWYCHEEAMPWTSNVYNKKGTLTKKNIINLVKKWNLPKGTKVRFQCDINRYNYADFYVTLC